MLTFDFFRCFPVVPMRVLCIVFLSFFFSIFSGIWIWGDPLELVIDGVKTSVIYLDTEGFESIGKSNVYDDRSLMDPPLLISLDVFSLVCVISPSPEQYLQCLLHFTGFLLWQLFLVLCSSTTLLRRFVPYLEFCVWIIINVFSMRFF